MRTFGDPGPAPPAHRARLTGQMSWSVPSDTQAGVTWTVVRTPDGHWECDCPGFRYEARKDGLCKHVDRIRGWLEADPLAAEAAAALCWPRGPRTGGR